MPKAEQAIEADKLHLVSATDAIHAERDREHPQAGDRPLASAGSTSDRDFWSPDNPDIVTFGQRPLSIYLNTRNQIVLRQEQAWDEEDDTVLIVDPANADAVIAKLQALKGEANGR